VTDDADGAGGYVVTVKPSARRANATVGRLVYERGTVERFDSRALAEEWARALSRGSGRVWVRDANPNDADPVDGYLVSSNRHRVDERPVDGPLAAFMR
jgi:hypothetical protein